jgi:pimeloyl-ACP methyl ester carboxylesterase
MYPGSGPSDRNNDVLFPPLRDALLCSGIAVCSFDKRGVGGSSGRWQDAGILEQTGDLVACLEAVRAFRGEGLPIGAFGHSQGGWVVVEAAGRGIPIAFVITNSGPGVSPYQQERFSLARRLVQQGAADIAMAAALSGFDRAATLMREQLSVSQALQRFEADGIDYRDIDGLESMFEDAAVWQFISKILDYDPAVALARISVPLLAIFCGDDEITPVDASLTRFRETVRPDLLEVDVFDGADHRLQHGDPPAFVDGYVDAISGFIQRRCA